MRHRRLRYFFAGVALGMDLWSAFCLLVLAVFFGLLSPIPSLLYLSYRLGPS